MHKIYILLLYIITFFTQYFYFQNIIFSENLLSSLISVLSIFFGFYVVSLSIFSISKFVGNLYLKEITDKKGYKTTLLHSLLNYYKLGLLLNLVSIFYFLFLLFLNKYNMDTILFLYLVIPLVLHNFIYSYLSLDKLLKIIIQETKVTAEK
jgi:hypothetical protein